MKKKKIVIVIFLQCLLLLNTASCKDTHEVSFFTHEIHAEGISEDMAMSNKESAGNMDRNEPLAHDNNRLLERGASFRHGGTSAIPHHSLVVHPRIKATKGPRWKVLQDLPKLHEVKKGSHSKKKSKTESHSKTEDAGESRSAAIVGGILAGVLAIPCIVTGIALLWKKCQKKTIRPADSEMGLVVISRTADLDGDLSEGEIIYEKKVVMCKKQDSDSKTAPVENGQPPGPSHPPYTPTGGPIIAWEATRGMQATHSSRKKMWTFNGALEFTLPTTTSDPCKLTPLDTSLNSLSASSLTSEPKTSTPYKEPNMTHPICPPTTPDVIFASESCTPSEKSSTSSLTGQCQRPEPKSIIFGTLMEFPRFFSKESSDRNSKLPEKLTWTVPLDEKAVDSSRELCNMPALLCDKVVVNIEGCESFKSSSTPPQNVNSSCGVCQVSGESVALTSINEVAVNSSTESCSIPVALGNEVVVKMEEEEEPYMSSSSTYQNSNSSSNNDMESEQFTSADVMDKVAVNFSRESCKTPVSLSNEVIDLEGRGDLHATTSLSISVNGSPCGGQLYTGENSMISATANEEVIAVDYDDEHYFKASESVKRKYTYDESKLESNRLNRDQPCKEVIKTMTKSKNDDCKLSPIAVDITGNEDLTESYSKGHQVENGRFEHKSRNKRRLIMEKTKETQASLRESIVIAKSLIIDDQTDVPIWKSALQAMKRSKERCQAIKAMMKKMKRSESRERVLDNSAYFKPDEKQMLTPLNEENHFKRNVTGIDKKMLAPSSTSCPEAEPPANPISRACSEYKPSRRSTSSQATHRSTLLNTSTQETCPSIATSPNNSSSPILSETDPLQSILPATPISGHICI